MKKSMISMIVAMLWMGTATAAVVQTVHLKNGTTLNGYIQQQDRNDNITFRSESAVICISGKDATTTDRVYRLSELDKKWVEWAEEHDAFAGTGDARTLTLNEIIFNNRSNPVVEEGDTVALSDEEEDYFNNSFAQQHSTVVMVKVLEKGSTIKYLELTPNTYTFNWNDVESIKAERRKKTALSGIDLVYQLKSGQEVRGQYAGESYSTLSLYSDGGVVETFDIDKVNKCFYKPINPNQTIFEQSELLDVVRTKTGSTFRGVIVERNYTSGGKYLVIQQASGSSQILKFADVQSYSKEDNPDFAPRFDILLKPGEVVINRTATDSVKVTKKGSTLVLDSINHGVVVKKEGEVTKVVVEYSNPQRLSSEHLILVKLDKTLVKKQPIYSFSTDIYEMKKFPAVSTETSINNTTKIEYNIAGQGVFALYDQQTRQAMPFIVK